MTLSRKVSIVVVLAVMCLHVLMSVIASSLLLNSYAGLEQEDLSENVARGLNALTAQVDYLDAKASDWANWDDTYDFMVSRDPAYIRSNLSLQTLTDLKINLLLFVDNSGQIVVAKGCDLAQQAETPVSQSWAQRFADTQDPLLQHPDLRTSHTGIVMLPEGPVLISARPILTSQYSGPSHGTLIMGRNLDTPAIQELAATAHLKLDLYRLDQSQLPADLARVRPVLLSTGPVTTLALDGSTAAGYALINDVMGEPRLVLRLTKPRTIYNQGQSTISLFMVVMLTSGMFFAGVTVVLVRRLVLRPLKRLEQGVRYIAAGDLGHRIQMAQRDEIGRVARAFDEMADRLKERDAQLATQNAALAAEVHERTRAEQGLRVMNDQLEERVRARTVELLGEVSERRRAQEELQAYAARLEVSNRELQEFAYVSSHDLQEPLRKIQAFGDRLRDRYADALDDQGRDYLSRMQNAASRMQALIEGLLTYSRVTTKAQPFTAVDLRAVAQEVQADLETHISRVDGAVHVDGLPIIEADALQMRQLFQNLIGNALKFHRDGAAPVVTISAERLNGPNSHGNGNGAGQAELCEIRVADNGIGFDEKYLDRIFQVFQRLHGRGVYEGAGIGLSVCRKIVERHGGSITAQSTPGQGSVFIVTLPMRQGKGATAS